jgi:two-component system, NtrC family, sensor histidine kinase PilS
LRVLGRTLPALSHLGSTDDRDFLESGLFGMAYFFIAVLCNALGRQRRACFAIRWSQSATPHSCRPS